MIALMVNQIVSVSALEKVGSKEAPEAKASAPQEKKYYSSKQQVTLSDGIIVYPGEVVSVGTDEKWPPDVRETPGLVDGGAKNWNEVSSSEGEKLGSQSFTQGTGGAPGAYSYTETVDADTIWADYKIEKGTEKTYNADGTVTTTKTEITTVCGKGLATCKDKWSLVSKKKVSDKTAIDANGKTYNAIHTETDGTITKEYVKNSPYAKTAGAELAGALFGQDLKSAVIRDDETGKVIGTINTDGSLTFYTDATATPILNKEGQVIDYTVTGTKTDFDNACKGCSDEKKSRMKKSIKAGQLKMLQQTPFYSWISAFFKAYVKYRGFAQLTAIVWPAYGNWVAKERAAISQRFCLAAGITNCAISRICTMLVKIQADNIVAGTTLGGKVVPSAALSAESTPPVEIAGMTRERLMDLLGNTTTIGGRRIALNDPVFDPASLGNIKLRFYHVQYGLTDNSQEKMHFNIIFKDIRDETNSSYGEAIKEVRWWPEDNTVEPGARAYDDLYKWSATKYNTVCVTFDPKMISGDATPFVGPRWEDKLCVPIVEYSGGATEITIPEAARAENATGAAAPGDEQAQPGANV